MAARSKTRWIGCFLRGGMVLFLAALATALTLGYSLFFGHRSTGVRMAAIERVLKNQGTLAEVEQITGPESEIFTPEQAGPEHQRGRRFWTPKSGQEVHRYGEEALPCYFDVWLLLDKDSQKILDWRLFRLDEQPKP